MPKAALPLPAPEPAPQLPAPSEVQAVLESAEAWHADLLPLAFELQEVGKWAGLDASQVRLEPVSLRAVGQN